MTWLLWQAGLLDLANTSPKLFFLQLTRDLSVLLCVVRKYIYIKKQIAKLIQLLEWHTLWRSTCFSINASRQVYFAEYIWVCGCMCFLYCLHCMAGKRTWDTHDITVITSAYEKGNGICSFQEKKGSQGIVCTALYSIPFQKGLENLQATIRILSFPAQPGTGCIFSHFTLLCKNLAILDVSKNPRKVENASCPFNSISRRPISFCIYSFVSLISALPSQSSPNVHKVAMAFF